MRFTFELNLRRHPRQAVSENRDACARLLFSFPPRFSWFRRAAHVWPVLINHSFRREGVFHERSVGAHDVRPSRRISLICREESEREAKREYNERGVSSPRGEAMKTLQPHAK